ncbi:MAG: ABC transporter permease [Candidatus Aureabacteria bacterium]|nr:ABC transporter permease [Candidatus Auribacterota bacterium]
MTLRLLLRYPSILLGSVLILAMAVAALLAPILAPRDPAEVRPSIGEMLLPPGPGHLLGTDDLGRDVLSRLLYGARISLSVGFLAVGISLLIGVILGAVAGYYGGWVDLLVMRLVEIVMMFPAFFFILMILAFLGPGIGNVMIVIGVFSWTGLCRLVRAEFLSLREREFVLAARGLGASGGRIIFRHILPNALAPVFVYATLAVGGAILTEAGISFLGLGVQPPAPSWGNIITTGRHFIDSAWWLTLFPGLAILVTVLSYNLLGQGLQDAFDPRLARMKR